MRADITTPATRQPLSPDQREVLLKCLDYFEQHARIPTLRALAKLRGYRSPNGANTMLMQLARKGWVKFHGATKARAWELVGLADFLKERVREYRKTLEADDDGGGRDAGDGRCGDADQPGPAAQ